MLLRSQTVMLMLALIAGCGARSEAWEDAPPAETTLDAGPLVCEIAEGRVTLRPWPSNPASCRAAISCRLWAGHGTHIDCPDDDCDIEDCICDDRDGFVANLATGAVRSGASCRYEFSYD